MKTATKFKICNWVLIVLTAMVLASGIQLELLHGMNRLWIWIHIGVGIIFMILCGWHLELHFKKTNWFRRIRQQKSQVTRILWWVALIAFLTGLIAAIHWCISPAHVPIGGIHGKIGFLMIILVTAHAIKRRKFYQPKSKSKRN